MIGLCFRNACIAVCAWGFPLISLAAPSWTLVPGESQLSFTATQNGAPITGEFKKFTGIFDIDFNKLSSSKMEVSVAVNSLTSTYSEVTKTLLSSDWFNVQKFPIARYKAIQFTSNSGSSYSVNGQLTIRDKTVPVKLNFNADLSDPNKGIFTGGTVIKRTDFGVGQGEWSNLDSIKDEVTINFKVVAKRTGS